MSRPQQHPITVVKLGGSILNGPRCYRDASREIARQRDAGHGVVAVVSARSGATESLLGAARGVAQRPGATPLSGLLATGEIASAWLLAIALAEESVRARVLTPREIGLRTRGHRLDAVPVSVDAATIQRFVGNGEVAIVPGFVGIDARDRPTLLGRGGSDLTALFLAHALEAHECLLVKDVDGLFDADPHLHSDARAFESATWGELLRHGGDLVQSRAVRYAARHRLSFRIAAVAGRGTRIGNQAEARGARDHPGAAGSFTAQDRPVTMSRNV